MLRAKILSTGSHVPQRVLSNHDLEKMVDTSDEWITERTGIKERRIAGPGETVTDISQEAAAQALKRAGIKSRDLDLIIVTTVTSEMRFPSVACQLQKKLGARNIAAFDVSAACSGFIYGLSVADAYIKSEKAKRVLLVGVDLNSRFIDWKDRNTCVLFGDGAGAVVLEATKEDRGILSVDLFSDGSMSDLISLDGNVPDNPGHYKKPEGNDGYIKMKGNETFKVAVKTLESVAIDTLKKNKVKPSELSLLIPHQANLRIIQATASRLGIPMDKVMLNLEKYGNTSAGSVPIALDEAVRTRRIRDNDYILLEAFGGGLTWASALIKW